MQEIHTPVLLDEVIDAFKDIDNGVIIDCTLGYGGHSEAILEANKNIKIIACDRDIEAIDYSSKRLAKFKDRVEIHRSTFSNLIKQIGHENIRGILADIGVSSLHLDKNERGFSVKSETLDMRMDQTQILDAKFVVNSYTLDELTRIFSEFGELSDARNLAQKIVEFRQTKEITSAKELANLVGLNPIRGKGVAKATLVFQAIRIEVNKELDELKNLLTSIKNLNLKNARIAIITFHSLEDRLVKQAFKEWSKECVCPDFVMKCECGGNHAIGKVLTKKALTASSKEVSKNSRSKCAKLRIFEIDR
ncbi:16S rRNA (cytosine(1402)-N(4))-methyltransferase RsmH [Campylobacter geochelonis]|uniref:Ribosomal RNA small subunit methyltransferase H n=1 Tax=Campylobacter geochelonis TaxID=1780362 RepID=A0A128EG85_9BACT|nr:16S rRNA (cytosine(1402)-N(4))-methyltransferase RsmH [Campylobacter geochelonis]QKF71520.1 16S rRNA m4C1402 methyltransferase [Campylobacter geochelonis]CZE47929.1 S-adenosyl-methyltransferase MraW [Campylobacter geochelonis]CZE48476.1 S-adenosyl-methyltransferase MraW [Campylobacter geochelonis]